MKVVEAPTISLANDVRRRQPYLFKRVCGLPKWKEQKGAASSYVEPQGHGMMDKSQGRPTLTK